MSLHSHQQQRLEVLGIVYVESSELIGPLGLIVMADHVLQCSTPCTKICITVIYNSCVKSCFPFSFYWALLEGYPTILHESC